VSFSLASIAAMDAANYTPEDRDMPVRSRGSLLAGTVALVGLIVAGAGCHSNPGAEHDSFSIPTEPGQQPISRLFSRLRDPAALPADQGQRIAPTPVAASPVPNPTPAPVALHPVPAAQAPANSSNVIASSWEPVQRVSGEQPASGPDMNASIPAPMPRGSALDVPPRPSVGSSLRAAPPVHVRGGAAFEDKSNQGPPPAGNDTLPQPRTLQSSPAVVYAGPMPPIHGIAPAMPREFEKQTLPPYVVEPPDLLLIQASDAVTLSLQRVEGQHLVAPDGTVNLGIYGKVYVTGMTVDQISDAVASRLAQFNKKLSVEDIKKEMQVDVLSYNSKYYYVITDGGGYGQQVYPILITGNETVLDAIAKVNGLPAVATKKKIWVARATRAGQPPKILPVDWRGVVQCGSAETNYQIFPGDRVFVQSDAWIRADTWLAKRLSPIQRGLGTTLLGASTVNAIKFGAASGSGLGGIGGIGAFR